jgi:restriction endonuclease S subunit
VRILFKDKSISSKYLFYFFRTETFANNIKETATGTMVRHTAPQRILFNKIPIPKVFDQYFIKN